MPAHDEAKAKGLSRHGLALMSLAALVLAELSVLWVLPRFIPAIEGSLRDALGAVVAILVFGVFLLQRVRASASPITSSHADIFQGRRAIRGILISMLVASVALPITVTIMVGRVRINGPLYAQILSNKDLVADILPPPCNIIESHLTAHLLVDAESIQERELQISTLRRLRSEYEKQLAVWERAIVDPNLRREMLDDAAPAARAYFVIADDRLIPLVRDGKHQQASALLRGPMTTTYVTHQAAISRAVDAASRLAKQTEAQAKYELSSWYLPVALGLGTALFAGLLVCLTIALRSISERAGKLAGAMTADLNAAKLAAETALRDVRAFRTAIEAGAIVSETDAHGRITAANDHFCKISGYSRGELLGREHNVLDSGTHSEEFWQEMRRTLRQGKPWRGEICNRAKDGWLYWVDTVIVPFVGPNGQVERFVSISSDITLRKHSERDTQQAIIAKDTANKAKSEFLANMSHEIRTPLTAILGFADLLRADGEGEPTPAQRAQYVDTICQAGRHLLTVINDILDLSKIEAGKMTVERIETPVLSIVREVESITRPRAMGKGIELSTRLLSPLHTSIMSDPTRLRQILMNLVGNAVKFTDSGSVSIALRAHETPEGARLIIDIVDTGPGMSPDQAANLFQSFSQADSTVTRKHGGTGLGLAICRRLATLMGGSVALVDTAPGKGSTFRIELPLEAVPGAPVVESLVGVPHNDHTQVHKPSHTISGRILLAEDGLDNQRLIAFHLRKAGAIVSVADNGRLALDLLDKAAAENTPFDLLLTDMQMPEMDGYTLVSTLRARGNKLPIVAITAHAMAEDAEKCLQAGCNGYTTKPIDKNALVGICAKWIEGAAQRSTHKAA